MASYIYNRFYSKTDKNTLKYIFKEGDPLLHYSVYFKYPNNTGHHVTIVLGRNKLDLTPQAVAANSHGHFRRFEVV